MVRTKSPEEIKKLAAGGKLLAQILQSLAAEVKPGATGAQIDKLARQLCGQHGVKPSFLGYGSKGHEPFPAAVCISVNEGVVHGIPNDISFQEGDLVGVDMGIIYEGLFLDSAHTVSCGKITTEHDLLLKATREALALGIQAAKLGNLTGDIGWAIQQYVEAQGYGVVRQLVGHGVGYAVHEEPQVPNYGRPGEGIKLVEGLVIAIEPMVTIGKPRVTTGEDGWTIVTADGSWAAHEEHTVAITQSGPQILTK